MDALAEQYPELDFAVKWADEDFGYNVGRKEYKAGREVLAYEPAGGSKEALELAAEVHEVELADEGYLYRNTALPCLTACFYPKNSTPICLKSTKQPTSVWKGSCRR